MNKATPEEKERLVKNEEIMDKNKKLIEELREWEKKNEEWMEGHKSRRMPQPSNADKKRLTSNYGCLD